MSLKLLIILPLPCSPKFHQPEPLRKSILLIWLGLYAAYLQHNIIAADTTLPLVTVSPEAFQFSLDALWKALFPVISLRILLLLPICCIFISPCMNAVQIHSASTFSFSRACAGIPFMYGIQKGHIYHPYDIIVYNRSCFLDIKF